MNESQSQSEFQSEFQFEFDFESDDYFGDEQLLCCAVVSAIKWLFKYNNNNINSNDYMT